MGFMYEVKKSLKIKWNFSNPAGSSNSCNLKTINLMNEVKSFWCIKKHLNLSVGHAFAFLQMENCIVGVELVPFKAI